MEKSRSFSSIALVTAAAALFLAGAGVAGAAETSSSRDAGTLKIKCFGSNACKGQGACATNSNACKGHNACKGEGFDVLGMKACNERLGRS